MEEYRLIEFEKGQLQRVGNSIAITNKLLALSEPQLIPYRKYNKWGFCTYDLKIKIDCIYDEVNMYSEDLSRVVLNGKSGFINKKGDLIIPFNFSWARPFCGGFALIKIDGNLGFINKKGEIIFTLKHQFVSDFYEGVAIFQTGSMWEDDYSGMINKNGEEIPFPQISPKPQWHSIIGKFSGGLAPFAISSDYNDSGLTYRESSSAFLNTKGEMAIPLKFYSANEFSEGLAAVSELHGNPSKWGFIDSSGTLIIPYLFGQALKFSEGMAAVAIAGKWGFIDKNGILEIECKFEKVNLFSEGLAAFMMTDEANKVEGYASKTKWGFINRSGKVIIPCIYDEVMDFSEGLSCVRLNNKYGFINQIGEFIIHCIYDTHYSEHFLYKEKNSKKFIEGIALIMKDGNPGYINKEGIQYWEG